MGLIKRIGSIFKAKANKAVEAIEKNDPIGIAKSELRESQEDLGKFEQAIKQASAQKILLSKQIKEKRTSAEDWKAKAKIAKDNENMDLATKAVERSIEFSDEADALDASLKSTTVRYDTQRTRFEQKRKQIADLKVKIKDAEIRFKTSKALNDLETSETSGGGVNPTDRINDMLDIVDEEEAMSEASIEVGTTEDQKLEDEFAKLGTSKKSQDMLDNL